ncbi:hypothetical protein F3Y22_tig00110833pilonHSYRG00082 [Hibiscus syriacus]|uniref:Cyclin-dependent protein kinase inhibitor SMR4 n=1 Tax=Hibiscus syriacus TaxID=106335 RepID=A0A6A2ZKG4_HIBSY|nr:hypothetical protein F3Y22_tig00110833pilonHSYRG00082 [Hibiscus syriacus]
MESYGFAEEGCTTPKHRIPEAFKCPPPPKKKSQGVAKRKPPKNGYFQPPDLDALFTMQPRPEACA